MAPRGYGALEVTQDGAPTLVSIGEALRAVSLVGFYTFGGTQANIALFREMFVEDQRWLTSEQFAEVMALANCLPGPSSCQILVSTVTLATRSLLAGVLAFVFFLLPSAVVMTGLGCAVRYANPNSSNNVLDQPGVVDLRIGVSIAAIAVIMQGSKKLAEKLCPDAFRQVLFSLACAATIVTTAWWATPVCLVVAGLLHVAHTRAAPSSALGVVPSSISAAPSPPFGKAFGFVLFAGSWALLIPFVTCQVLADGSSAGCPGSANIVGIFYRIGCLVFGGGPVVVPLLLTQLAGLIEASHLLLGFAAVNLLPGPMFNVAAYCGALLGGWPMAVACWAAIMLPGIFMALGALPFWSRCREIKVIQQFLGGVNAAAAGLMAAACVSLFLGIVGQNKWRASALVLLVASGQILVLKAPLVIALGALGGLGSWLLGGSVGGAAAAAGLAAT